MLKLKIWFRTLYIQIVLMSIEKYVSDPFIKYVTKSLINYQFISII